MQSMTDSTEEIEEMDEASLTMQAYNEDGSLRDKMEIMTWVRGNFPKEKFHLIWSIIMKDWVRHFKAQLDQHNMKLPKAYQNYRLPQLHVPFRVPRKVPPPPWRAKAAKTTQDHNGQKDEKEPVEPQPSGCNKAPKPTSALDAKDRRHVRKHKTKRNAKTAVACDGPRSDKINQTNPYVDP